MEEVKDLSKHWNRKLWIELPEDFDGINRSKQGNEYRPYLCCMLRIEVIPSWAGFGYGDHHEIDAIRIADGASGHGSNTEQWDHHDVSTISRQRLGHEVSQVIGAHEMGHLIGLPHVGVTKGYDECSEGKNTNASVCYGNNIADRRNIMGSGMRVDEKDAKPWLDRIEQHFPGRSVSEFTVKAGDFRNALHPVKIAG